jgi:cell wall assembly regulator SMI1
LRPGADDATIERLRDRFPAAPARLVELYRWHDGSPDWPDAPHAFHYNMYFSPIAGVLSDARMLDELAEDPDWFWTAHSWHRGWLPFLSTGAGNLLCVDTEDALRCGSPSVVYFDHESHDYHTLVAPSFFAWLSALVESLEAGIWRVDDGNAVPAKHPGWGDAFDALIRERNPRFVRDVVPRSADDARAIRAPGIALQALVTIAGAPATPAPLARAPAFGLRAVDWDARAETDDQAE